MWTRHGALDARHAAWAALGLASVAAAIFLGYQSRGLTLHGDEWDYAIRLSSQPLGHALFQPPQHKYLMVFPLLLYKGLFETFGIGSYAPYRVVGIGLVIGCAVLFFLIARQRVGDLLAVPPTVLLLFFGSAFEVVVTSLRLPSQVAIAAGLGMLLALEQRTLRADVIACLLLAVALLSHPESAAFAVAAIVLVLFRPAPERWRRFWVYLAPIALYGILSAMETNSAGNSPAFDRLDRVPEFVGQSFVAITAAITGVSGVVDGPAFDSALGWVTAGLLLVVVGLALIRRLVPLTPMFWALLAALGTLLISTALAPVIAERTAGTPRYLYPGAVLVLLLLVEVAGVTRMPRITAWVATAVLAAALVTNFQDARRSANGLRFSSTIVKAELGAIDIAHRHVDPNFVVFTPQLQTTFGPPPKPPATPPGAGGVGTLMRASEYLRIAQDFGSPAYSPQQLARLSAIPPRRAADIDLARGQGIRLRPAPSRAPAAGERPTAKAAAGTVKRSGSCLDLLPESGALRASVTLPPDGAWLSGVGSAQERLALSRFAPYPSEPLVAPTGARTASISIPRDGSATPWTLWVVSTRPVSVCGLSPDQPK